MKLCPDFSVAPEGIKGFRFWYCSIEYWTKSMKLMGLYTAYSVIMQSWVAGVYFSVQLCAYD